MVLTAVLDITFKFIAFKILFKNINRLTIILNSNKYMSAEKQND